MNNENEQENEYKRAEFFFNKKITVHVVKKNGIFLNGLIIELSKEFFVIFDKIIKDQIVFFNELKKPLEHYKDKEVFE